MALCGVVHVPAGELVHARTSRPLALENVTPDQAGLPVYGGTRRVPGLRREEELDLVSRFPSSEMVALGFPNDVARRRGRRVKELPTTPAPR